MEADTAVNVAMNSGQNRMSAKAAIDWKIERLRDQANKLEVLAAACERLEPDAEEALWRLLMDAR